MLLTKRIMATFINISNHPTSTWSAKQIESAKALGEEVIDIPFPNVAPSATKEEVSNLAKVVCIEVCDQYVPKDTTIMVQGEMTLVYALVNVLISKGYRCVASTTERVSYVDENGNKVSKFEFNQFREY